MRHFSPQTLPPRTGPGIAAGALRPGICAGLPRAAEATFFLFNPDIEGARRIRPRLRPYSSARQPPPQGRHSARGVILMTMRMLIDARHQEETRVAVVKGNRIEEFDFESAEHKQLKGNIYLAKVTRVEPSLQAAFVDYGGNRHGFLAFSEIHPDYYQIPREDREALLREEAEHAAEEERLRAAEDARYESRDDRDEREDDRRADDGRATAMTTKARKARRRRGRPRSARSRRERARGECRRRASPQAPESAPPLQDPGRHPPPPGAARPGRQGGARQQGRGADHLSEPRRPLLRADAQHQPRRRHQPQDLERRRPQAPQADHGRISACRRPWAASSAPPACRAPRPRSSATSTISPASGTRSASAR